MSQTTLTERLLFLEARVAILEDKLGLIRPWMRRQREAILDVFKFGLFYALVLLLEWTFGKVKP